MESRAPILGSESRAAGLQRRAEGELHAAVRSGLRPPLLEASAERWDAQGGASGSSSFSSRSCVRDDGQMTGR